LLNPHDVAGRVATNGATRFGLAAGTPVVIGSGDGFLANVGSGCDSPRRISITLGTSGGVRQMIGAPALDSKAGAFCYRADSQKFLLGCASSNGGNLFDWARRTFGSAAASLDSQREIPIFLPWLNGERSVEWDPKLRASWHGLGAEHPIPDLIRSVIEGV